MLNPEKRFVNFLSILLLTILSCATKHYEVPTYQFPHEETILNTVIREMVDSLHTTLSREYKKSKITFIDVFNREGIHTELDEYLTESFYALLLKKSEERQANVVLSPSNRRILREQMAQMGLRANEADVKKQSKTWKRLGSHIVILGFWDFIEDRSTVKITLQIFDVRKDGFQLGSVEEEIKKDQQLYRLLGERGPGEMFITSQDPDAIVYCDSISCGEIGENGKSLQVPYGNHTFVIKRKNYVPFVKSYFIDEFEHQTLFIGYQDPKNVPLKAFLLNAALPMSASWIYGSKLEKKKNSVGYNIASAGSFYAVLGMYLLDRYKENSEKHDFLSEGNYNLYRNIRDAELYTALGLYGLNLVTGLLVGKDYTAENRKAIEIYPTDRTKERSDSGFRTECNLLSVAIRW